MTMFFLENFFILVFVSVVVGDLFKIDDVLASENMNHVNLARKVLYSLDEREQWIAVDELSEFYPHHVGVLMKK